MTRMRSGGLLLACLALVGCGGGGATEAPAPSEAPAPTTEPAAPSPTEVPTTPTTAQAASSIVSRAPTPATGCPATDPSAFALPGTVHSSNIDGPETLDRAGSPHRFPDGVTITGATLAIEPCTLVLVGGTNAIWINGTLLAQGDAEHPIRFDAADPAAQRGSWGGLYFGENATNSSRLAYVTIEDAGAGIGYAEPGAIWVDGHTALSVNEVTIARAGAHGISLRSTARFAAGSAGLHVTGSGNAEIGAGLVAFSDDDQVGSLPELTQQGNDNPEIVVIGDSARVATTQTWRNPGPGIRYHLRTEVTIEGPSGPILTIAPGTTLAFDQGKGIFVGWGADGALVLDGQSDATRITLTSARSVQSPGDWPGVLFGEHVLGPGTRVAWTTIAFAGGDSGWGLPHGCGQAATGAGLQEREVAIAQIAHVRFESLRPGAAAIWRGLASDQPTDYTAADLGNEFGDAACAQGFVEPTTGCPDTVPPCGG